MQYLQTHDFVMFGH